MATSNTLTDKKSLLTNLTCLILIGIGYLVPQGALLRQAGFFALSGAITNWLAVYMLFERVPFLYGSGVIPLRFREFKLAIKNLIMQEFFTEQNLSRFFTQTPNMHSLDHLLNTIDFEAVFEDLKSTILSSGLGSMLNLVGGGLLLNSLKEPIIQKLKSTVEDIVQGERFQKALLREGLSVEVQNKIEEIIDTRLAILSPDHVKKMVQDLIQAHLGWLVVWGGVFGALMGAGVELLGWVIT